MDAAALHADVTLQTRWCTPAVSMLAADRTSSATPHVERVIYA